MKLLDYKRDISLARDAGEINELLALAESDTELSERSVLIIQRAATTRRVSLRERKHSSRRLQNAL